MPDQILVLSPNTDLAAMLSDVLSLEGYAVTQRIYHDALLPADVATPWDLLLFDYGGGVVPPGQAVLPAVQELVAQTACPLLIVTTTPPALAAFTPWLQIWEIPLLPAPFTLDTLLALVQEQLALSRTRVISGVEQIAESRERIERAQRRISQTAARLTRAAAREAASFPSPNDASSPL
jgi:DNA-binding response OmpR family regulator